MADMDDKVLNTYPEPHNGKTSSAMLHRQIHADTVFPNVLRAKGNYLFLQDGRTVFDASGGAAVVCIGHGNQRVHDALIRQIQDVSYIASIFFTSDAGEALGRELVAGTSGRMSKAYIVNSGSEAMEAAMKLSRQYFLEKKPAEPQRTRYIARLQSYHGNTLGALSMSGHKARRAMYEPMLLGNVTHVSPCFPYRNRFNGETDEAYVERLAAELDREFQRVGPETVCAFIAEPVVGAALGCVPPVPGYMKAMKAVCDKHGALLVLDEIMCGMGRTGTLHAWEQEGVVPDIQAIGKALGGGFQPIAGILINHRLVSALDDGSGAFMNGHTYQAHPAACAAALEVQRIIREENLLQNVKERGEELSRLLVESLGRHPNVGNIRGRGLFWGIEFVKDKETSRPFPLEDGVAMGVSELGLTSPYSILMYPGTGTLNGKLGDHIIISPPFNITVEDVQLIVRATKRVVDDYFSAKNATQRQEQK